MFSKRITCKTSSKSRPAKFFMDAVSDVNLRILSWKVGTRLNLLQISYQADESTCVLPLIQCHNEVLAVFALEMLKHPNQLNE